MNLLGFKLEHALKVELENIFDNKLDFVDEITLFLKKVKTSRYEAVILDIKNLQEVGTINLIMKIGEYQKNSVILILGETSSLKIVAGSIKAGAYDYILKPVEPMEVVRIIEKSVKDYKALAEKVLKNKSSGDKLIGQTKEIIELYKVIGKVAISRVPVLVFGEKGTGKTSVAKAIHQFSDCATKPLMSINCTSFRNELLERKLFGYEKGAFEGAIFSQLGELEKANGGTLHLGNIEALSLDLQSKILYFLEEHEFFRMGGAEPKKADIRIVATTSENLEELIEKGKFIDELYRKLRVLEVNIPSLRDRKDDIPLIIDHYLVECNMELQKHIKGVSKPALKKLMRYDWPGNVNELKNAIKSAVALCRGTSILIEDLPSNVLGKKTVKNRGNYQDIDLKSWVKAEIDNYTEENTGNYYATLIEKVEKELIKQILEKTNGKKVETAEILGITRNTLRTKMTNYNLE